MNLEEISQAEYERMMRPIGLGTEWWDSLSKGQYAEMKALASMKVPSEGNSVPDRGTVVAGSLDIMVAAQQIRDAA